MPLLLLLSSRDQKALPMAGDLFPVNWATSWEPSPASPCVISSPRISFSCDLDGGDDDPRPRPSGKYSPTVDGSSSSPSSEFDFCAARGRSEPESSAAADELFSDGVLLPLCLLYKGGGTPATPAMLDASPNLNTATSGTGGGSCSAVVGSKSEGGGRLKCVFVPTTPKAAKKKERQKEAGNAALADGAAVDVDNPTGVKQSSSFWRFRRSSSLNSGGNGEGAVSGGGRRSSLICSFPLLSRSKSAGNNPVPVIAANPRQQHHLSATSTPPANDVSSGGGGKLSRKGSGNAGSGKRNLYYYGQQQHGGAGVRISPVLNVPSPYVPRGGSSIRFLSFGHLLCSVKDRRKKKAQLRTPPSP